jgi:hypothetical protein
MRDCNICRGEQRIRLPVYEDLPVMSSYDPLDFQRPRDCESWREFPCPACCVMVPSSRICVVQEVQERQLNSDPGFIEHVQRCLVSALASSLFKRGLVKFEEGQADAYKMTRAVIASVKVVAPETVVPERVVKVVMLEDAPRPVRPKRPPRPKKPKPPRPRNPFGRVIDL